jgi:TatD DNase family protein
LDAGSLEAELSRLGLLLDKSRPEALGECGLDRASGAPWELQLKAFSAQAELARRLRLPLVLHVVRAFPEILARRRTGDLPGIVHGFRGGAELALELWRHGLRSSFGFSLMASPKAQAAFRRLPAEALLLESDTENRPLADLYALAASLRGIPIGAMAELVGQNLSESGIRRQERG